MAPRSRRRTSEGFSLVELQPVLTSVTSSIADELSSQGVDIDTNSLLMGIQSLVNQLVMNNPNVMMASDDQNKPPYNLAADLLAMAYNHYQSGNKREAVQNFLTACEFEDAAPLAESLLMMNNQADLNKRLAAAEETDDTDDSEDESDDGEMSDEEIDSLISEGEGDDQGEDGDADSDDTENDDAPMGGTSSAKPVTASTSPENRTKRILAIKMSSAGDENARKRAQRLLG